MLTITPLSAFNDNYIWVIENPQTRACAVVDPGDAAPVLDYLNKTALKLSAILITHHHIDHIGGVEEILQHYPAPVYGPAKENIPHCEHPLHQGNKILVSDVADFTVSDIPGHTLGHIAYHHDMLLFCGDTLFAGGCGRVFEGTPLQMLNSLNQLAALDPITQIYCAHEYTEANLLFAEQVEPNNQDIQQRLKEVQMLRKQNQPTLPSSLESELKTNPFLRCHESSVQKMAETKVKHSLNETVEVFSVIREWKNKG